MGDDIAEYRKQVGHDSPDCDYLYEDQGPVRAWPERSAPVARAEAVTGPILGNHIQVIVNGCVQFDQDVDQIEFTSILHTSGSDGPPCEMQFSARYGHRRPDGTIET